MPRTAPKPATLGERLRALIEARLGPIRPGHKDSPVCQLERQIGLPRTYLHQILRGSRTPRQDTLERILTALGSSQTELWSQ